MIGPLETLKHDGFDCGLSSVDNEEDCDNSRGTGPLSSSFCDATRRPQATRKPLMDIRDVLAAAVSSRPCKTILRRALETLRAAPCVTSLGYLQAYSHVEFSTSTSLRMCDRFSDVRWMLAYTTLAPALVGTQNRTRSIRSKVREDEGNRARNASSHALILAETARDQSTLTDMN